MWCDEALVIETIPAERTTLWWLVRRKFRGGNSWAIVQLMLDPGWKTKARLLAKGPLLIAGSLAALPIMVWRPVPRVRALRTLALGVGLVSAVGSLRYSEYAPRHRVPA